MKKAKITTKTTRAHMNGTMWDAEDKARKIASDGLHLRVLITDSPAAAASAYGEFDAVICIEHGGKISTVAF